MLLKGINDRLFMENEALISKKLQKIHENETFEELDAFSEEHHWAELKQEDKELLGKLFIKKGEMELKKGESQFKESFDLAERVAPDSASVSYLKGKVFASYTKNARCLAASLKAFEQAVAIHPGFFEAHFHWGVTLIHTGMLHQNAYYFQKAQQKFQEAFAFLEHHPVEMEARYFWKWGLSWHLIGITSEEPFDFHQAVNKYRQAKQLGLRHSEFWYDFGDSLVELGELTKQYDLLVEAIDCFHLSVCDNYENFESWFKLACCHEKLYEIKGHLQHFEIGLTAFDVAARSEEPNFYIWLNWGRLYLNASKLQKNHDYLLLAIEKFKKAATLDPDYPLLLSLWAEAEIMAGIHSEKLELFRSAEQKIIRGIKQSPKNPDLWGLYGTCLTELGRYFSDEAYYLKAIEKFLQGLSLNEQNTLLLYGLGLTYFSLGEHAADAQHIENAVRCYQKVHDLGETLFSQFWNDWGVALMKLSELTVNKNFLEEAIQKFEQFISMNQEETGSGQYEADWLYNYGCALDFYGDLTEDVSYYECSALVLTKALHIDPQLAVTRYNLATTLSHWGEAISDVEILQNAVNHFKIILSQEPEDEMACNECGIALLNIAELIHETSRPERSKIYYDEAEHYFLQALALGCTHAYYNLACLHSLLHNYSAALHYLEQAEGAGTLPSLEDMLHDEWLENLVETPAFRHFISQISH